MEMKMKAGLTKLSGKKIVQIMQRVLEVMKIMLLFI